MIDNASLINKIEKINLILSNELQKSFFDKYYEKRINYTNSMLLYAIQKLNCDIIKNNDDTIIVIRDGNRGISHTIHLCDTLPLKLYIVDENIYFFIDNDWFFIYRGKNTLCELFSNNTNETRLYEPRDEKLVRNFFKTLNKRDREMENNIINYLNSKV